MVTDREQAARSMMQAGIGSLSGRPSGRVALDALPYDDTGYSRGNLGNVALDASLYDDTGFREYTSASDPNSWFQSGVAPYVLNDMIRDLSANEEERDKNYAMAAGINWNTHPESYKMRDEETGWLYRGLNPYRGYTGVGGNMPLGSGNLGWDLYRNFADDQTQAELSLDMPFWGGDLTAGLDWNSEEDITNWLLKFVLPFGNK